MCRILKVKKQITGTFEVPDKHLSFLDGDPTSKTTLGIAEGTFFSVSHSGEP